MCNCCTTMFLMLWIFFLATADKTGADIAGCDYFDTVNLNESLRYPNASYLYDGRLLIPAELTAEIDHKELQDGTRVPVERHMRGCACKLFTCLRLCCQLNRTLDNGRCKPSAKQSQILEVIHQNRSGYILQDDLPMPCDDVQPFYETLKPELHFDESNRRLFCVHPYKISEEDVDIIKIVSHNCTISIEDPQKMGKTIALQLSLVGLLCTICVYLFLEELQNLHGQCFICFMISLFIGFLMLLLDLWNLSRNYCLTAGYLGYFFVMAAFLWLSVISLGLWSTFCSSGVQARNRHSTKRFVVCNAFAWGVAAVLTGAIYLIDKLVNSSQENEEVWLPGVGHFTCWINVSSWSAMIYFYGPMAVLIAFNLVVFALTAHRIMVVQRELRSVHRQDKQRKFQSDTQTYSFFLRLFIITGVSWSLEIISYLVQNVEVLREIFLVADYFHWCQGIIIFVLFILKPRILRLCKERYASCITEEINR